MEPITASQVLRPAAQRGGKRNGNGYRNCLQPAGDDWSRSASYRGGGSRNQRTSDKAQAPPNGMGENHGCLWPQDSPGSVGRRHIRRQEASGFPVQVKLTMELTSEDDKPGPETERDCYSQRTKEILSASAFFKAAASSPAHFWLQHNARQQLRLRCMCMANGNTARDPGGVR